MNAALNLPSWFFLIYLFVLLPWAVFRGTRQLEQSQREAGDAPAIPREAVWRGTLIAQVLLLVLTWLTAHSFGGELFALADGDWRALLATGLCLGACLGLRELVRALRTEAQRRAMTVYQLAPRTRREWGLYGATVLLASVAEEGAYRGVALWILEYALPGVSLAIPILLCALAFALGHRVQGWLSMGVIFVFALLMHALVWYTETLVFAMVVHGLYDLLAGVAIAREAGQMDRETPT